MSTNFNTNTTNKMTFADMGYNTALMYPSASQISKNNGQPAKLQASLENDVLEKKEDIKKKNLIKGGIIAAAITAVIAGIFILRGRNSEKAANTGGNIVDSITGKTGDKAKESVDAEAAAKAAKEATEKAGQIIDGFNNPKPSTAIRPYYSPTPVSLDETSVEKDMAKWIERFQKAPQKTNAISARGEHMNLNNPVDIDALKKIKPHNYTETSDIFFDTRTFRGGFPDGFAIIDGKLSEMNASYNKYVDYALGASEAANGNGFGYRAGISKDGRACVELQFQEQRQDQAARGCYTRVLLRSKDANFTQDQLDAIKMFQNIDEEKIAINSPLGASFMLEEEGKRGRDYLTSLFFNKNMFLSIIKNEADKYKDFDVQGLLSKGGVERYVDRYAVAKKRQAVK